MMKSKQVIIGLTGGIGSGKSYVARLLEQKGYPVYYTDDEAKRLMLQSDDIKTQLKGLLGDDVYLPDGQLNKKKLAAYLFCEKSHADKINAIVHPVVRKDFLCWVERQQEPVLIMECAILFESGFNDLVTVVVAVSAPENIRLLRIMSRDHCSSEQALARINSQYDEAERCRRADFVLLNDGEQDVYTATDKILKQINP